MTAAVSPSVALPMPPDDPRSLRTIRIAASSSLLPGHPAWRMLPSGFRPTFGTFADWPACLRDEVGNGPLAVILFLEDVTDPAALYATQDDPEKVKAHLRVLLDAIDRALTSGSRHPLIVGWSLPSPGSAIVHSRRRSPWTQLGQALDEALYARAGAHPQLLLLPLDKEFARIGTQIAFDRRNFFAARCRLSAAGLRQLVGALGLILERTVRPARMRSKYGTYPEYHTSLDDLSLVSQRGLAGAFNVLRECLCVLEANRTWTATMPCEPQLGRRGLYPTLSTRETKRQVRTMMDVLAYADGIHDLVALAERTGAPATDCATVVAALAAQGLLVETHEERSGRASSSTETTGD